MPYKPTKPAANDAISVSQSDIQGNFSALDTVFGVNHTAFSATSNAGRHNIVDLAVVSAPATVPTNYVSFYASGYNLFVKSSTVATPEKISGTAYTSGTNGKITLPSGLIMAWGQATANFSSGLLKITLNFTAAIDNVQLTLNNAGTPTNSVILATITNTGATNNYFEVYTDNDNVKFFWFAIGH